MTTYEQRALEQLESADTCRSLLAKAYDEKPLDFEMVGALKAGVRFSLDAALVYATLHLAASGAPSPAPDVVFANAVREEELEDRRRRAGLPVAL